MVQVVEPLKPWVRYPGKIFLVVTFATSENSHPTQSHEIEKHCYHPSASGGKRRLLHQEHKEYRWPVRSLKQGNKKLILGTNSQTASPQFKPLQIHPSLYPKSPWSQLQIHKLEPSLLPFSPGKYDQLTTWPVGKT
jgi:hypothetical protein